MPTDAVSRALECPLFARKASNRVGHDPQSFQSLFHPLALVRKCQLQKRLRFAK